MTERITAIGFNAAAIGGDLDGLDRQIDCLVELGTSVTELKALSLNCVSDCKLVPERVRETRAILDRYDGHMFTLHAPIPINLMDDEAPDLHFAAAMASLELASGLAMPMVVIHPGWVNPVRWSRDVDSILASERESLAKLGDRAVALGVKIAYENVRPNAMVFSGTKISYGLDPRALARQLDMLNHPAVMACLDVSHAHQSATWFGVDTIDFCASLAPQTNHIHFSDSTGVLQPPSVPDSPETNFWFGVGDMHVPAGWGTIDFAALGKALPVRPNTAIVIELEASVKSQGAEQTLAAARALADCIDAAMGDPAETMAAS